MEHTQGVAQEYCKGAEGHGDPNHALQTAGQDLWPDQISARLAKVPTFSIGFKQDPPHIVQQHNTREAEANLIQVGLI